VDPDGRQVFRVTAGPHGRTIWFVEDQVRNGNSGILERLPRTVV
jgi:hypothetical protein